MLSAPWAIKFSELGLKRIVVAVVIGAALGVLIILRPVLAPCCLLAALIAALTVSNTKIEPFSVVLIFIVLLPLQNILFMQLSATRVLSDVVMKVLLIWKELVLLGMILYLLFFKKIRPMEFCYVDRLMLAYVLWSTLYLILPESFFPESGQFMGKLMSYRTAIVPIGLYFMGRGIPFTEENLRASFRVIILVAMVVSAIGILQWLFLPDSFWLRSGISYFQSLKGHQFTEGVPANFYGMYGTPIKRLVSTYADSLAFGFSNIFIIPLAVYCLFSRDLKVLKNMPAGWAILFTIGIAQALNLTRAAILVNLIEIGSILYYLKKQRVSLILLLTSLMTLGVFSPLLGKVFHYSRNFSDSSSLAHIKALETGLNMIMAHPMGFGLGYGGYVGRALNTEFASESLYFTIAVERGVAGVFIFCLAMTALVIFCIRNMKYLEDAPLLKGLSCVVIVSTVGYALASLTTEHWQAFVSSGIYWIFAGILVQAISAIKKQTGGGP